MNALVAGIGSYIVRPCGLDLHGPTISLLLIIGRSENLYLRFHVFVSFIKGYNMGQEVNQSLSQCELKHAETWRFLQVKI